MFLTVQSVSVSGCLIFLFRCQQSTATPDACALRLRSGAAAELRHRAMCNEHTHCTLCITCIFSSLYIVITAGLTFCTNVNSTPIVLLYCTKCNDNKDICLAAGVFTPAAFAAGRLQLQQSGALRRKYYAEAHCSSSAQNRSGTETKYIFFLFSKLRKTQLFTAPPTTTALHTTFRSQATKTTLN